MSEPLHTALSLAADGLPVLPLRKGKVPFGNCPACAKNACGGRPNMKTPGPCTCPHPCHGWAAATTDPGVINSSTWVRAWREAAAVAYHPGGAGLTVVDLDNAEAIAWARATLPATRTVPTTRGEHWLYQGAMQSANGVRSGVDLKSTMAYARWLGPGTGTITVLPDVVRALTVKEPSTVRPAPRAITVPARAGEASAVTARPRTWTVASPWRNSASSRLPVRCTPPCTGRSSPCCPPTADAAASPTPTSRGCSPPPMPRANRPGTAPTRGPTP